MKKKKKVVIIASAVVASVVVGTTAILAAPTISLSKSSSGNNMNLSWTNNDTVKSYNYDVMKSVNGGTFASLTDKAGDKVTVLNIYCDDGTVPSISFSTYDGENCTLPKSASLKQWMEAPNATDSRGYGRGLIEVTPVSINSFNSNPDAYLKKGADGKYNYDVVVFGTWDGYLSQDLSNAARNTMSVYLSGNNSCIMGHDVIRSDGMANFNTLRGHFNIKLATEDGLTLRDGTLPGHIGNGVEGGTSTVRLRTNNVFTTYPWYIGGAGTVLTVPKCHCVHQVANGNVEITFDGVADMTDQYGRGNWNYYLTVYNNTAMIQTGHSSGSATEDEQKIWANLLFYLGDTDTGTTAQDPNFKDINAPDAPTIGNTSLTGINGSVSWTAKDNGTKYDYYVMASERTTNEKTSSNTVTETRTTGVAGYSYVIDGSPDTMPDNTIDTTSTSLNYQLKDYVNTYLHIKTIDGAGNVSGVTHVLLHENVPPVVELSQDITKWTNQNVTITAVGTDEDGRVVTMVKPDESTAAGNTTTYVVEKNGVYPFKAIDNSGETGFGIINITNIDKVAPNGSGTVTQPTATNRYAQINFKATDDASGVKQIKKPDGTVVEADNTTYNVTLNGTYKFEVTDVAGNVKEVSVDVVIKSDGLTIKYVDDVTGSELTTATTITGNLDDPYTTEPKDITGYALEKSTPNTTGKLTIDPIEVVYSYRKLSNVVVSYVDLNSKTNIVPETSEAVKEGYDYTTTPKELDGYKLMETPDNANGTMGRSNIYVTYGYKKISGGVDIKYVDDVTGEEIIDTVHEEGNENDEYTSSPVEIPGYLIEKLPNNPEGKMTVDTITVEYRYRKVSDVTAKYIDLNGNKTITTDVTKSYKEGYNYSTEEKIFNGYVLITSPENKAGTMGRENITVTYEYKKIAGGVEIDYQDDVTGQKLEPTTKLSGNENDEYTSNAKTFDGYALEKTATNPTGLMTVEKINVLYTYRKLSTVTTKYVDMISGEEITPATTQQVKQGYDFKTEPKALTGYVLMENSNNTQGTMQRENVEVTYYYKKVSEGVVVNYVDLATNELLDSKSYTGNEGDSVAIEKLAISGYTFDSTDAPAEMEVALTVEPQTYTLYYRKGIVVTVIHKDITNNKVLDTETLSGEEGKYFNALAKEYDGYLLMSATNAVTGKYDRNTQTVVFEYRQLSPGVQISYVDEDGNVMDEDNISGFVGDRYATTEKEYEKYDLVEVEGETEGLLTPERITVTYKYEKKKSHVYVIYVDEFGEKLLEEEFEEKVDTEYKVTPTEIENYRVKQLPDNLEGIYELEDTYVTIKMERIPGTIIVLLKDQDGNVIGEFKVDGFVGDEPEVFELPEFEGYTRDAEETLTLEYIDGELVAIVNYAKIPETGDINVLALGLMLITTAEGIRRIVLKKREE